MSDQSPSPASAPRPDAAAPGWYPHPRRPGTLRYWNGTDWVEADATRGWYPDPANRALLRLWTGQVWGETLDEDPWAPPARETAASPAPAVSPAAAAPVPAAPLPAPIPAVAPNPRLADAAAVPSRAWVTSVLAVACLVAGTVVGGVVVSVVGGSDEPAATRTVTASASSAASPTAGATEDTGDGGGGGGDTGTAEGVEVTRVLSSRTLAVKGPDGKVEVRLLGLGPTTCDTNAPGKALLKDEVVGQDAVVSTLVDPATGEVAAYVDVAGEDVGEALIRAGLATAAVGHPRAPAYVRAQAAATPYCTPAP